MITLGIDIGTTTICAVAVESRTGRLVASRTVANDAATGSPACQSPERILVRCRELLADLGSVGDGETVGVTGQMHGIVYLDEGGRPVSPLFTWQDVRGDQPWQDGLTYAGHLSRATGHSMASGYGLTTHFFLQQNGLLPPGATVFCSIADYVAMNLAGRPRPLVHPSNAAGFGLFSLEGNRFDPGALAATGIDSRLLPEIGPETVLGGTRTKVAIALGDNQASFLGSVADPATILVNVGTGSQVSMLLDGPATTGEVRPYWGSMRLGVGSPLCGGDAYATVKRFLEASVTAFGGRAVDPYTTMNELARQVLDSSEPLTVDTRFRGTRTDPGRRGAVTGISAANLTPGQLCLATLQGIVDELYELYAAMPQGTPPRFLVGSGNGVRKNPVLQTLFSRRFGLPLRVPLYDEEAAYGAALFSLVATGVYPTLADVQGLIRYQD